MLLCLVGMIEKWKEIMKSGRTFGVLMPDFCKVLDYLHQEPLIAKLDANYFDLKLLRLIQKIKVGNADSSWKQSFYCIPPGVNLVPTYFNIFLCCLSPVLKKQRTYLKREIHDISEILF